MKAYSNEIKQQALKLYAEHKNYKLVARLTGITHITIKNWVKPEYTNEQRKRYYNNAKKERTEYCKNYYNSHKEYFSNYSKEYRKEHKKEMNKNWLILHHKKYKTNPLYKIRYVLRNRITDIFEYNGLKKNKKTEELIGCTVEHLKEHVEKQFMPGMTWENHGKYGWHIDHIIPCASFNLLDSEEQKRCFHYTNLQPLWAKDNLKKGAKIIMPPSEEGH